MAGLSGIRSPIAVGRTLAAFALVAVTACGGAPGARPLDELERPVIIGHGGAKDLCAENTIPCFRLALELGATALEADLQVLGDGSLVMFHDDDSLEQTGVPGALLDLTLAEFQALDAGWEYSPDGGSTHPHRGQGLVAPTLDEFLAAFPGVPVLLDVKPESPEMSAALLEWARERLGDDDRRRLYIKSNDTELPDRLRALAPTPLVAFSELERGRLIGAPEQVADLPPSWIDLPSSLLDFGLEFAAARGDFVTASTIDDPEEMAELLGRDGLGGIVTNRPDLLRDLLGR